MPKMKYQTLYFNEFFVKRECQNSKSHFQNVPNNKGAEGSRAEESKGANTINFLCFYNSSYLSL